MSVATQNLFFSQKFFSDLYNISCTHRNQEVMSFYVSLYEIFDFFEAWEIMYILSIFL